MPFDQKLSNNAFQKLDRQLTKLRAKPIAENVHRFRTYGRRIEALLEGLIAEPNRNHKRLLKMLCRLRAKAGKVRDLDVQIAALRNLKISREPARKIQLLQALNEERIVRERKLVNAFDAETVEELRKRLKRAAQTTVPVSSDPLTLAVHLLAELGRHTGSLSERVLHQYRIVGKRARYLAELAGDDPLAEALVMQLKHMQDVLGDWHDWLKLTEKAEGLFGGPQDSALVAALGNITGAKFRESVTVLAETRANLPTEKAATGKPKRTGRAVLRTAAVA